MDGATVARTTSRSDFNAVHKLDGDHHRVLPEDLAGSPELKVEHISQWIDEDQIEWYTSPSKIPILSNKDSLIIDAIRRDGDTSPIRTVMRGGPRGMNFFNPTQVRAVITTCGGLCPGLNNVIRDITMALWYTYGVREIYGIPYGYEGFYSHPWRPLNPDVVSSINHMGGTILGTSRGGFDKDKIMDALVAKGINQVFIIGGDGTHRGATIIFEEAKRRKLKMSVVGVPKTIDNDIPFIDKSFGFDTAVGEAKKVISCVHTEVKSCTNGIGIVVLMGRQSGFIAMHATLSSGEANFCLIPEVPFALDGPNGLLPALKERIVGRSHAVIVVAEGAGAHLCQPNADTPRDKSGNPVLPEIGPFLKQQIKDYFKKEKIEINLKYVDPSYIVRSIPANPTDSIYCTVLAHNAVYGAMAGFSGFTVACINTHYCFMPLQACSRTRTVDPEAIMWQRTMEITGQPDMDIRHCPPPQSPTQ